MIDFGSAIKKPFTDAKKLVVGILLSFIPIVNWIARGYILECSGLGKNKKSDKMPAWKDTAELFVKGFLSILVGLLYAIPAIIVMVIAAGVTIVSLIGIYVGTVIPPSLLQSVFKGEVPAKVVTDMVLQNWALALPAILLFASVWLAACLLALLAAYLTPMATLNYIKFRRFGAAFDLKTVFKKAFTVKYFSVWLLTVLIGAIIVGVLKFIPYFGALIGMFIAGVMNYSLLGDVYRET